MKTMNFKSTCKFCGVSNLAWQELIIGDTKKWVLFKNEEEKHTCLSSAKKKADKVDEKALAEQKTWEKKVKATANKPTQKQIAFKESLHKKMEKKLEGDMKATLESSKGVDANPAKEVGKKVKLYDATKLYQPVSASSVGSTYYVVAMWEGLNMACRIKTFAGYYTISLRIEGLNYEKWKNLDMLSKFNHSNGYASNHYNAKNITEVNAVVYAFIGMINKPALSPMPDLSKIL